MEQLGGGFAQWYLQNSHYVMSVANMAGFVWLVMSTTLITMQVITYVQTLWDFVILAIQRKLQEIDEKITRSKAPRTDCSPSRTRAQSKIWGKL